jgi:hypothetical protein
MERPLDSIMARNANYLLSSSLSKRTLYLSSSNADLILDGAMIIRQMRRVGRGGAHSTEEHRTLGESQAENAVWT